MNLKYALLKALDKVLAFIPTKLPIGVKDFDTWAGSILKTYDFPDNDSTRWALATMIMHLGPTAAYKSKRYFGLSIHAAAAKQVAGSVFHELKLKQKAAEAEQKQAEATALQATASIVQPIQN